MSLHPPKYVTSWQGLGLNTVKDLSFVSNVTAIGSETWGQLEAPWQESGTIIADKGYVWRTRWEADKPFIITKFFDATDVLVGIYCDISSNVRIVSEGFEFEDMYLDVWIIPGKDPVILDVDELDAAYADGLISQKQVDDAKRAASKLVALYRQKSMIFDF